MEIASETRALLNVKLGPAGFEPTTCRRGDRSIIAIGQVRHDHGLSCNIVPFLRHRRD